MADKWWKGRESNPRPRHYETGNLTKNQRLTRSKTARKGPKKALLPNKSSTPVLRPDAINPDYYRRSAVECVDAVRAAASSEAAFLEHCRLEALAYLFRGGSKPDNPLAQDAGKAIWWATWCTGRDPREPKP